MAQEFTLDDLIPYLDLFEELGLDIWIDGSWGLDALLGEQTRSREDLYFLAEKRVQTGAVYRTRRDTVGNEIRYENLVITTKAFNKWVARKYRCHQVRVRSGSPHHGFDATGIR